MNQHNIKVDKILSTENKNVENTKIDDIKSKYLNKNLSTNNISNDINVTKTSTVLTFTNSNLTVVQQPIKELNISTIENGKLNTKLSNNKSNTI